MRTTFPGQFVVRRRRLAMSGILAAVLLVCGLTSSATARPGEPSRADHNIAIMVSSKIDSQHLSEMQIDDEISRRTFDNFFDTLDPMKLFFYQSDIDEFASQKEAIDDYVKSGDVRLAKRIFDRFLQRVTERIAYAQKLVDQKPDFTLDESMVRDPKKMKYASSEAESNERWRKRVKYDLLVQTIDDEMDYAEAVDKLHKRYRGVLRNWEQTDNDELLEMFLTALTTSFDPHSSYMAPSTLENFNIQMRLELNGIGASLESKYGETIVRRIVPGGAADKDGRLKINDVITGVAEGRDGEFVDIVDMKINDVVQLIRGKPGTVVRLEVNPADKSGRQVFDITRARIELKDEEARSEILERLPDGEDPTAADQTHPDQQPEEPAGRIIEHQPEAGGKIYRIGVINLPSFYMDMDGRRAGNADYKSTTADVRRLLEDFNRQHVDLVVMDLRFNGGGSLPESVETTGLFIDQGPVVQVKGPDGRIQPYDDEERGMVWSGPLIVVINKFSASASEIFAGAIQDYGRGIIVGDHSTHGKGTVQQLFELGQILLPIHDPPNYGALKLTIQQFYRPSGDSTQNRGVVSDIELPHITSHWDVGESDLDYALKFDRVMPLKHLNYRNATAQLIEQLRDRSEKRCEKSDYFAKERHKIESYLKQKEDPTVTLNKEKFLAERKELNSEKEQEEIFESLEDDDRPVFPKTPYNDEVIAIALDYLELLGQNRIAVAQ
jgi:carboxyl-terminal processing protease